MKLYQSIAQIETLINVKCANFNVLCTSPIVLCQESFQTHLVKTNCGNVNVFSIVLIIFKQHKFSQSMATSRFFVLHLPYFLKDY